jgi:zinc transporter 9
MVPRGCDADLKPAGPTALGLTTTLLSLGLSHPQIRNRLLIFSASAPAGAVLTYLLIKLFGGSNGTVHKGDVDSLQWWTGVVLLFSVSKQVDLTSCIAHA